MHHDIISTRSLALALLRIAAMRAVQLKRFTSLTIAIQHQP